MTMSKEVDNCCGTTADKQRVRAYISTLEKDNQRLRSKCKAQERVIQDLLRTCEEVGLTRRLDS